MDHICLHHPPVFPPSHIRLGISLCYTDARPSDWVYKLHASHFLPQTWVTLEFSFAGMSLPWLQFQWAPVEPAAWTSLQSFLVETSLCVWAQPIHSQEQEAADIVTGFHWSLTIDFPPSLGGSQYISCCREMMDSSQPCGKVEPTVAWAVRCPPWSSIKQRGWNEPIFWNVPSIYNTQATINPRESNQSSRE